MTPLESDRAWAFEEARQLEAEALSYRLLIKQYGDASPTQWRVAEAESREVAQRLRRLAAATKNR